MTLLQRYIGVPITHTITGVPFFPNGHFIVVTGYNDRDRKIFAHSITEPNKVVAYDEFIAGWAKTDFWMLLIHPKGPDETP